MDQIVTGLRAIAEPTRLRLLSLCDGRELAVGELMDILGQSQPRVSRHLKILTEAGLLERFREGSRVYYRADRLGAWHGLMDQLFAMTPSDDHVLNQDRKRLDTIRAARSDAAEAFFRENAADWDRLRALHVDEAEVEGVVLEMLAPKATDHYLDLGTGTGRLIELVAGSVDQAVGLDRSQEMLGLARAAIDRAGFGNATVRHGDLYALPFNDNSFDAITIHQVLHFLDRPAQALSEAQRVLKPGGRIVIADFAPHTQTQLEVDHHHQHLGFTEAEMAGWLTTIGLKTQAIQHLAGDPLTVTVWAAVQPQPQV